MPKSITVTPDGHALGLQAPGDLAAERVVRSQALPDPGDEDLLLRLPLGHTSSTSSGLKYR